MNRREEDMRMELGLADSRCRWGLFELLVSGRTGGAFIYRTAVRLS